jgi:hypothetical protein
MPFEIDVEKPVILIYGGPSHRALFKPLDEHFQLAFLSSGAFRESYDVGIKALALEAFVDDERTGYATNEALWQTSDVMNILGAGKLSLDGTSGHPHLKLPDLAKWFPDFVNNQMAATLVRIFSLAQVHSEYGIVAIVTHEDVSPEGRILTQFGRSEDIPVVHIPHANHFIDPRNDIHGKVSSDYLLVAGEWMADFYVRAGADPTNIEMVGAPQWDWLYQDGKMPTREQGRRALGLDEDDLVLSYATTWDQNTNVWGNGDEDLKAALGHMLTTARAMDAKLILKIHPGERPEADDFYQQAMWSYGVEGCITRKNNEHVIRASDCMIVQGSSNVGVASVILGTPIVELWQCGTRYPEKYGIPGTWGEDLSDMIEAAINDVGDYRPFARAMNYDDDGGAVERITEWMKRLIPKS